jgi:hypothetical protein
MTRTGHPQVEFAVETTEDAAEAVLDRYDEKERDKKGKKKHGVHRYALPRAIGDFEIAGGRAREAMLRYASAQNEIEPDDELGDLIERKRPESGYDATQYG